MKGFFSWFTNNAKIKRWVVLILVGMVLTCYAISIILNTNEMELLALSKMALMFIIGFTFIIVGLVYIQKRTLEIVIEAQQETDPKMKSLIFNKDIYDKGPKIVVIGGGTGLNTVLKGLKKYTNNITAIVTIEDNDKNNSTELPTEEIKNSIIALSNDEEIMKKVLNFSSKQRKFENREFGDICLSYMEEIYSNFGVGIEKSNCVLKYTGKVLPATLDKIKICAELKDGTIVEEKEKIATTTYNKATTIKKIYLRPTNYRTTAGVTEAIKEADAIIIGPGNLYTSVIPNLLIKGITKNIKESKAIKVFISNLMTTPGETDNYSLSEHINAITEYVGENVIDFCLCDTGEIIPEYVRKYNYMGAEVVENDISKLSGIKVIQKSMAIVEENLIRHDTDLIATTVIDLICNDLKYNDKQDEEKYVLLNSKLKKEKKKETHKNKIKNNDKKMMKREEKVLKHKRDKKESRFEQKYKERIKSIKDSDDKRNINKIAYEEARRLEKNIKKKN